MRIENTGFHHYYASKWKKENEVNAPESKKTAVHQEELSTLHKEATELTNLMHNMQFEEVVREDKLNEIREKMAAGVYHVSGKDVVLKMMGER